METLAYLHLACANEQLDVPDRLYKAVCPNQRSGVNWRKFSGRAYTKLASLVMSLLIVGAAHGAIAASALRQGQSGPEVADLQNRLTAAGCYSGPITGYFGSITQEAVKRCQRSTGLAQDGVAGKTTLARLPVGKKLAIGSDLPALTPASNPSAPAASSTYAVNSSNNDRTYSYSGSYSGLLRQGSQGQAVSDLQRSLSQLGYYQGSIDGIFGSRTEQSLIRFQRDRGLTADGIAGPQVYQALGTTNPAPIGSQPNYGRQLRLGDRGAEVEDLQRRLQVLGLFNATVTGYYGPITQEAVIRFQQRQGLSATGVADSRTLSALNSSTGVGGVDPANRYLVIVPQDNTTNTLARVRQFVPSAFLTKSRLGDYIQAGAYATQQQAETQSSLLRARGLDARVNFQ